MGIHAKKNSDFFFLFSIKRKLADIRIHIHVWVGGGVDVSVVYALRILD